MDIVFIGAIVVFATLTWGMACGCARLGERK
ncbi:potassium ABC transporter ATPase [Massilia rhizosphaerae]|nr:potassium ABC transporter ATPase [Massilia rhizosphaerae]